MCVYHLHAHDHSFKSDQVPVCVSECALRERNEREKCNDLKRKKNEEETKTWFGSITTLNKNCIFLSVRLLAFFSSFNLPQCVEMKKKI